jgi:hypothetical protein
MTLTSTALSWCSSLITATSSFGGVEYGLHS